MTTPDNAMHLDPRRLVEKVVAYVVWESQLLVFTHNDFALEVTGVQVPAGTIESGESPEHAVVREVLEETGLNVEIARSLGTAEYDFWPSKSEMHRRHFFELRPLSVPETARWLASESDPSDGGPVSRWTCWWIPLQRAHVLCAGFSAKLGELRKQIS